MIIPLIAQVCIILLAFRTCPCTEVAIKLLFGKTLPEFRTLDLAELVEID